MFFVVAMEVIIQKTDNIHIGCQINPNQLLLHLGFFCHCVMIVEGK